MVLVILRGAFIVLVAAVITLYVNSEFQWQAGFGFAQISGLIIGAIALAAAVVAVDASIKHKRLSAVSGVFLGLVAGLTAAYALSFVVDLIGVYTAPVQPDARLAFFNVLSGVKVIIGLITCYVAISLVIQTKDDFRFVIPYVEFAKQVRGSRPVLLDTSVVVDGRIIDVIDTRIVQGVLIVPKFVLDELQLIADQSDKLKRARGRRGLDMLQKLRVNPHVEVRIEDHQAEGGNVDQKLISLAQELRARVMTNDYNLNKIATLRGVEVINLNDVAKSLRPVVLPGERLSVKLTKPGESPSQGVGYLDDGTMVVVEQGRDHLGTDIELIVTSTLQTSAGRMIFGRFDHEEGGEASHSRAGDHVDLRSEADDSAVGHAAAGTRGGMAVPPTTDAGDATGGYATPDRAARPRNPGSSSRRNPRRG